MDGFFCLVKYAVFLVSGSKQLIQRWLFCRLLDNCEYPLHAVDNQNIKVYMLKQHFKNLRNRALICFFYAVMT